MGRRLDYADMPMVRAIVGRAAAADYRLSAFVREIVKSPAFRMKAADDATTLAADGR